MEPSTATATAEAKASRTDLIAAAAAAAETSGGPGGFVRDLFGRVAPEDLTGYAPEALAELALAARAHLAAARPGRTVSAVRLSDVEVVQGGRRRDLTVLEAINANRPFLLDSTLAELVGRGYQPRLVAHPILGVERDADGALVRVVGETTAQESGEETGDTDGLARESFIHIHLDRIDDEAARAALGASLARVYADVAAAAADHAAMVERLAHAAGAYGDGPGLLAADERAEARAFLDWLRDGHFVLLGLREYRTDDRADHAGVPGSGLGLLRDPAVEVLRRGDAMVAVTPEIRAFLEGPEALLVTKASLRSRVRQQAHLDMVAVKLFPGDGGLPGELRLVGLFTGSAYASRAEEVPYLRRKVAAVLAKAGLDPTSHAGRSLVHVLETYPRDDLFQIDADLLLRFALAIVSLADRPRVRVLARPDKFGRFVSLLAYLPKDRTDARLQARIGTYLAEALGGRLSTIAPDYPEGPLARLHVIVATPGSPPDDIDAGALEAGIAELARTWADSLREALAEARGGDARGLAAVYADAFPAGYREMYAGAQALPDIAILERISEAQPRAVDLFRRPGDPDTRIGLKVFSRNTALPLSERVPVLENLGFRVIDERSYRLKPEGAGARVWLHDMVLERAGGGAVDVASVEGPVEAALLALARDLAESDAYNRLVLEAGLGWRDVALVRALGRYLRQLRIRYGQDYLAATLSRHPALARRLVALFYARFDPRLAGDRAERQEVVRAEIEADLAGVTSLDEDRILRRFVNLVEAAQRTNFFQIGRNGLPPETIAFKFRCARVDGMPLPRPLFEIFVYSPRVEGVHLRFGYIARGGLRWSDRPEDFRTEVLGLVKAQQVKNAVIVPVGAKGGFFPKRLPPPSDRQAWMQEGTESYRIFIRTLLSLTDNIVDGAIVPPPATVRHDEDDAYLVVAADKGTATFSDVANALSLEAHHWLGDAFASGGSQGYDHKQMGITARGAWEAVKRHFREIDIDIQAEPVTVAGVGDMSGDVFGNGMLLSRCLKLVAAFDHRDIFLDPDPDPAAAHAERKRLFDLPRSSWADYDRRAISPGGGVFSRQAKTVPLSPQIRARLGLDRAEATPAEVMQAILRAPVDLLWFGGIGTYVRATAESDDEAGDRANDAIRITGAELRARVVGEGANLGLTQRGRIEAARRGVRLNTDAIDNSAGVNTSDVEVNIKIALATPERDGRLSPESRNALLAGMTEAVADLVLRNNQLQTLALSLAQLSAAPETGFASRMMQMLEAEGRLDRGVEFLPSDAVLAERAQGGEGLTRPELAVLLAYAKLALKDALLDSAVPDDPYLARELERAFPPVLVARYPDAVRGHRLRREIIATSLANAIVNRGGPTIVSRLADETGAEAPSIAAAFAVTRDAFGLVDLNKAVDGLDGAIAGDQQLALYAELQDLLRQRMVWFIRNGEAAPGGIEAAVARYRDGIAAVSAALPGALPPAAAEALARRIRTLVDHGVPGALASRLAALGELGAAPDIVQVAEATGRPPAAIAATHFALADLFRLNALAAAARAVPVADTFDRIALERAVAGLASAHRALTAEAAAFDQEGAAAVEAWSQARGASLARIRTAIAAIAASGLTVSKVSVAASLLGDLAQPGPAQR
ncbi:NAD-glutamate dehydrogenase [Methylobacterium platani]|uniref:NAD-glutamate dehydrogenase n=2 Tax=Methylobacterium platani TaxID=427683 RepID=A0A179S7T1_9HYPH|nr:NAD-glutamate dehydrogenase [Methylobacterium platani]KMO19052.1 NAD-glutamate dehydrogenase [Methylobacterium platani JCM 14648]OAS20975.1 NAD-glutamate dehydrogenase [Methylobacterium platani]